MSAKDIYHDPFVRALQKDGWMITHDPLTIPYGKTELLVDIGAESLLAAERNGARIAVEIKSFIKPSLIQDLKEALGNSRFIPMRLRISLTKPTEHSISPSAKKPITMCFVTRQGRD